VTPPQYEGTWFSKYQGSSDATHLLPPTTGEASGQINRLLPLSFCQKAATETHFFVQETSSLYIDFNNRFDCTYDHRFKRTGHPVRSAIHKLEIGRLVVGWVTTSEYLLLYVFAFALYGICMYLSIFISILCVFSNCFFFSSLQQQWIQTNEKFAKMQPESKILTSSITDIRKKIPEKMKSIMT